MSLIFISHSSQDDTVAEDLRNRLRDKGYNSAGSVFLDFDSEGGIMAGQNWEQTLYQNIRGCRAVIVLCSKHSMASQWCFVEITHARAMGKHLFPVKIDDCDVDGVLTDRQVIDITTDKEAGYERLWLGMLAAGLDPADAFDYDESRSPYPGLLAFQEADAAVFFGRDEEIGDGLDLLNKVTSLGETGLVMVLGASGTGKSSLVRAGLLPRLRRDTDRWIVVDPFRPHNEPFRELAGALSRTFDRVGKSIPWTDIAEQIQATAPNPEVIETPDNEVGSPETNDTQLSPSFQEQIRKLEDSIPDSAPPKISRYLRLLRAAVEETAVHTPDPKSSSYQPSSSFNNKLIELASDLRLTSDQPEARVLFVIDQFEELLGHNDNETVNAFLGLMRDCIEQPNSSILVLATMRSDFLGQFQKSPPLLGINYQSLFLGPMASENIAQIIERPAEVAGIELESGLSQALVDDTKAQNALPLLAFSLRELNERYGKNKRLAISDYRDGLGGLQAAVAKSADDLLDSERLNSNQQDQLRNAFLSMVRVTEEENYARRPAYWDQFPQDVRPLLERFISARLLISNDEGEGRTVEVVHEALFRSWTRLKNWLDDDREFLLWRKRLGESLQNWERTDRNPGALLTGPALPEGQDWLKRHGERLSAEEANFIRISLKIASRNRIRTRAAIAAVIMLIIFGVTMVAFQQQQRAIEAEKALIRANAFRLVAQFDNDKKISTDEDTALWDLALSKEPVRRAVLDEFMASVPNAEKFSLYSEYLLHALLAIDPKNRIRPVAEALIETCLSPELKDASIVSSCGRLARELQSPPLALINQLIDQRAGLDILIGLWSRVPTKDASAARKKIELPLEHDEDPRETSN